VGSASGLIIVLFYFFFFLFILQDYVERKRYENDFPLVDSSGTVRGKANSGVEPIVIFILGGISQFELMVADELRENDPDLAVYLAGNEVLTPETFLERLKG
jgi:hypothetical protein